MGLRLLPRESLVRTNDLDQADWNYRRGLGAIQRSRFRVAAQEVARAQPKRLLEVGYGSGVFCPELARHCETLSGLDVHDMNETVEHVLSEHGVAADLHQGSTTAMPFADNSFDAVVTVSTLEFVDDLGSALAEVRRVLAPGGTFVVVTPRASAVVDAGLRALTGERAEDTFQGRRQRIMPSIEERFTVLRRRRVPALPVLWLYTVVTATPS